MDTQELVLGKSTVYSDEYSSALLQRIERRLGREQIKHLQKFKGVDIWHLYEMTYLNLQGMPCVCMGIMKVPSHSDYIVESKSLKLYELSFTQTKFRDLETVEKVFERDLSRLLECDVTVELYEVTTKNFAINKVKGTCLEKSAACRNLVISEYTYNPKLLSLSESKELVSETLYTNLFRSLCPVTSQPDHATISVEYRGNQIDKAALLKYLISLRNHQGFHEQCVELIYSDIMYYLKPDVLTVSANFTRRGGIDINPVRSNTFLHAISSRTVRQ